MFFITRLLYCHLVVRQVIFDNFLKFFSSLYVLKKIKKKKALLENASFQASIKFCFISLVK